ncbi:replication protein A 70 kDa DNA-binding subunit-like [Coffea eugenioides]|uniref:replication protein A 70 kDa DNA-binding subunit-like n=1 Tax=Coffea eugenioides TaxID=49369 RepID=UPI000F6079DD|nr:replication protein A 70 kDa DNA-binding subunit-like [Coffea eugenioides]
MANLLPMRDIVPHMTNWSCDITVQERQQITSSMGIPTRKQKFVFYDSEGSRVEGIIFNDDIPRMSQILQIYKKYRISNAEVRPIPSKFQTSDLTVQWVISSRTVIDKIPDGDEVMPVKFCYSKFTDLVQYMDDKTKSVDVLGVVISALERKTVTKNSRQSDVQKFVLLNEESQTVLLSLWDSFLANKGEDMLSKLHSYPVIIARRVKVNNYNGVALGIWFDSTILVDPPIQEAIELKNWALRNTDLIKEIVEKKAYIKYNPQLSLKSDQKTTWICNITSSQKTIWVKAQISFEHIFQKYWYMSYKNCCRATAAGHEVVFTCNSCKEKHPAVPRCRFDVDLTDSTGVIPASLFGELAEKLLTFNALEAMQHFNENVELPLEFVHNELKSKTFLLHIKPVQTQLADARQRYTIIYYSEIDDATDSGQLAMQPKDGSPFPTKESDTIQLGTPGENSARSKICVRLSDRFDEPQNIELDEDENAECSSSKKQKLN